MTARGEIRGHIQEQLHVKLYSEGYGHICGCSIAKPSLYTWGCRQKRMVCSGIMNNTRCEKGDWNQKHPVGLIPKARQSVCKIDATLYTVVYSEKNI